MEIEHIHVQNDLDLNNKYISDNRKWMLSYMIMVTSVYFCSEVVQLSPLISSSDHYKSTSYLIIYDQVDLNTVYIMSLGNLGYLLINS